MGSAPDTEEIKDDAQIMLAALNTLVRLLLSNILATGQSILDDFFYLTRSTLADGSAEVAHVAQEVADTLRPDHPTSEDAGPVQADQVEKQTGDLVQTIEESKEAVIEAAADLSTFKGRATLAAENDFREVATARFHKVTGCLLSGKTNMCPDSSSIALETSQRQRSPASSCSIYSTSMWLRRKTRWKLSREPSTTPTSKSSSRTKRTTLHWHWTPSESY
jgi:hypothetical protein